MLEADPHLRNLHITLDRVDARCLWASQAVLDLMSPEELVADVLDGEIAHKPDLGVLCGKAMSTVTARSPPPSKAKKAQFVKSAMQSLHSVGLVGMHDAGATPEVLDLYAELSRSSDWTLRVYAMLTCEQRNTFCPDEARRVRRQDDAKLTVRSVKLSGGTNRPSCPKIDMAHKS